MKQLIAILMICLSISLFAQDELIWSRDFKTNYPSGRPLILVENDSITIVGRSKAQSIGQRVQIVIYNVNGDTLNTIDYGFDSTMNDKIIDYKFDTDKNLYLLLQNYLGFYKSKLIIQKYTIAGELLWMNTIESPADTSYLPISIGLINDTCIFINGYKEWDYILKGDDVEYSERIPKLFAYNTSGSKLWEIEFDPYTELKHLMDEIIPYNNTAILFGNNHSTNYCMLKVGLDKTITVFNDIEIESGPNDVIFSNDNNLLITSGTKYRITKLDHSGEKIWVTYYGTNLPWNVSGDHISSIIQDDDGNITITGCHRGDEYGTPNYSNGDILTLKYDKYGQLLWENRYEFGINNYETGISIVHNNEFLYVGGYSQRLGIETDYDYLVLKMDYSTGDNIGIYRFNGPVNGNDKVWDVEILNNGHVILTGVSKLTSGYHWTTQLLSDVPIPSSINDNAEFRQFNVFPNPAKGWLYIKHQYTNITYNIELRNLFGQVVKEAKNIQFSHYAVNVSDLRSGVYFYGIRDGDKVLQQGKVVVK